MEKSRFFWLPSHDLGWRRKDCEKKTEKYIVKIFACYGLPVFTFLFSLVWVRMVILWQKIRLGNMF